MALSFPVALTSFADLLVPHSMNLALTDSRKFSVSARGEVIDAAGGSRRWTGFVQSVRLENYEAQALDAMIEVLRTPGASFIMYDLRRPYPRFDPTGSILGASVVTMQSVSTNRRDIALSGLPSGYTLARGDYLSFTYTDPLGQTQYSYHRVVAETVEANGSGVTPTFEVVPHIPRNVILFSAITLKKARFRAMLIPGSSSTSTGVPGRHSDAASIEFVQTKV